MSYVIIKRKKKRKIILNDSIEGYKLKPKVIYSGLQVEEINLVDPVSIEKVLKKKAKIKLECYLKYIVDLMEEDANPSDTEKVLDQINHYKNIVETKYRKYLDDKYIDLLLKKIKLLEHEIKLKRKKMVKNVSLKKNEKPVNKYETEKLREIKKYYENQNYEIEPPTKSGKSR